MAQNTVNTRAAQVTLIGKGTRLTSEVAADIVANTPAEYDWTARGAVPKAIDAYVAGTGTVPVKQRGGKGEQTLTDYGRGCDTLRKAVAALVKDNGPKTPTLRVTLSGEGGGSSVVPMDSDLGKAILAFLADQSAQ